MVEVCGMGWGGVGWWAELLDCGTLRRGRIRELV